MDAKTIEATKEDGIEFRYDLMEVTPNTLKAHPLTWFAARQSKGTEMAERIFHAYFTQGQNIAEVETLARLADEIGINSETAKAFLVSDTGIKEVRELERRVIRQGIQGVPSIRIGKETLSGAQPVEVFLTALQKALQELGEV